jgi:sucrose-6-phosphate hydrolase SacC (GH32 family)
VVSSLACTRTLTALLGAVVVLGALPMGAGAADLPAGPANPGFETGDLSGWTVVRGTAFGPAAVSAEPAYWGGAFRQQGGRHLWGFAAAGDDATGVLRSASFAPAADRMSFLVAGGHDPRRLYVALVRDSDGAVLRRQTGMQDEAYVRITWDVAAWRGVGVHLEVVDDATGPWGHINLDDVDTSGRGTDGTGLTPLVLGQENHPPAGSGPDAPLFAADPLRPQFHLTPYQGWMNDPNGLAAWRGRYEVFFQYHPPAPYWGPMHWAHARTGDLVRWRNLPIALYPDPPATPADASGIFSGGAVVDGETLHAFYTRYTDPAAHPGATPETVEHVTTTDGATFVPDPANPVVAAAPPGSAAGFRDPKVVPDPAGDGWLMVVGSGDGGRGKVQLYRSADLSRWTHAGVLLEGDGTTGAMWECPALLRIGGTDVLLVSVDGATRWFTGRLVGDRFEQRATGLLDAGPDFYATQDVSGADRPVVYGWMDHWGAREPTRVNGHAGAFSLPREVFVTPGGGAGSRPVAEVATLRTSVAAAWGQPRTVTGTADVTRGRELDLEVALDVGAATAPRAGLDLLASGEDATTLRYDRAAGELVLDTTRSGYGSTGVYRAAVRPDAGGVLRLRVLVDRSSVEVFAADGTALTARVYPRYAESDAVRVVAEGGAVPVAALRAWRMGSAWTGLDSAATRD